MVRERELAAVVDALDTPGSTSVVLGAVGLGRSWLLEHAAVTVRASGRRVLSAVGSADEHGMPYAALHQLLHGDLEQVDTALPARQRAALLGALGYDGEPVDGPLLVASATLTTLRLLAAPGPVAVVVDDVHLLDAASAQVLAFLARRVASEPVSVLVTTPGQRPPLGFERATAVVDLAPLGPDDAEALLDATTPAPTGRTRLAVLASADGNPLVLRELAREHARDPFAERAVLSGPLRPTRVLTDAFPVDLRDCPPRPAVASSNSPSPPTTTCAHSTDRRSTPRRRPNSRRAGSSTTATAGCASVIPCCGRRCSTPPHRPNG